MVTVDLKSILSVLVVIAPAQPTNGAVAPKLVVLVAVLFAETGSEEVEETVALAVIVEPLLAKKVAISLTESPPLMFPIVQVPAGSQARQSPMVAAEQLNEALAGNGKLTTAPVAALVLLFLMVSV